MADFRDHVFEHLREVRARAQQHRDPAAEPSTGEIEDVFDQLRGAQAAGFDVLHEIMGLRVRVLAEQAICRSRHGEQRVAQVMAEHRNKLLAQLGVFTGQRQLGLRVFQVFFGFNLQRDQTRKRLHGGLDRGVFKGRRFRVQCAQRTKQTAVGAEHRYREVTLESVDSGRWVVVVQRVFAGFVDEDGQLRIHAFKAQRRDQVQFTSRFQAKPQIVEHGAGCPAVRRHPGNGSKAHAGHFSNHLKDCRDCADPVNRGDIRSGTWPHRRESRLKCYKKMILATLGITVQICINIVCICSPKPL